MLLDLPGLNDREREERERERDLSSGHLSSQLSLSLLPLLFLLFFQPEEGRRDRRELRSKLGENLAPSVFLSFVAGAIFNRQRPSLEEATRLCGHQLYGTV
jgi:hypothetical protein